MIQALLLKEWIKLRAFMLFTCIILAGLLGYLWNTIDFQFATIEPENMMWYRFTFLDHKPYEFFKWFLYVFSIALAFVQFIPEWSKNRIRIIAHLPLKLLTSLRLHVSVGLSFITLVIFIATLGIYIIMGIFYPYPITNIFLQDMLSFWLGCTMLYLGASSAILEKDTAISLVKILLTLIAITVFITLEVDSFLAIWLLFPLLFFILCYDSFLSVKEQRLGKSIIIPACAIGIMLLCQNGLPLLFGDAHHHKDDYYLFYSPIKKRFVYQKNFGEHQFKYGFIGGETFDRKTYESYLPFIYWADLDIQKKLPISIDGKVYKKNTIKKARLSLGYKEEYLEDNDKVLYPLINSIKDQGVIVFPDNMFHISNKNFTVFHHDNFIEENLTKEANEQAQSAQIHFPIKNIWGKFTNMKVYDLGYFLQDANGDIFNFRRGDDKTIIKKVKAPKELVYISINENKQKKVAGFAIDKNNQLYIISWKEFHFKPIKLSHFDYKTMDLQILSNPKYYQARYDDGENYYISVFDKEFNLLDEASIK